MDRLNSSSTIYNNNGLKFSYVENFYSQDESNYYLNLLLNELNWEQKQINLYGKSINLPRLTAYFSNPGINYSYSGINHQSTEYPTFINSIKSKAETLL